MSGQSFGQYADTFNEQALLATAAHQENQRLHQHLGEGRASYRNSARISRTFEGVDPLKSLDDPQDGNVQCKQLCPRSPSLLPSRSLGLWPNGGGGLLPAYPVILAM